MNRLVILIRHWIGNRYCKLRSMSIWGRIYYFYASHFGRKWSYQVDANSYNFLFLSPRPSFELFVDSRVWNRASERLPERYTIPDRVSLEVLFPMTGQCYDSLFSNPLPMWGIYVNGSVWMRIKEALPEQYVIPDPASIRVLQPMTADYYNSLFTKPVSHPGIVVDGKVWGRIAGALPQDFRFPDSGTVETLKNNMKGVKA